MTESIKLLNACHERDVVEFQKLLPQVKNPAGVRDWWNGRSLLHYSCLHGWLDVTRRLAEQYHCDPESRDKDDDTPLHVACRESYAPLHVACRESHVGIVRYLVSEQRCSTACQNKNGDTPLHKACRAGHLAVTEILLTGQDCSAACISKNNFGETVLHYSCHHGWLDMTRKLVEQYHCDPESRENNDDTPLHVACREGHVGIVRYLVSEQRCSTACQNKNGDTPLHKACRAGHLAVTEILLTGQDCSAACISKNNFGKTILHYSCHQGWLDMTRKLVEQYHCDPESRENNDDTPLHVACREGHVDIVRYLVSEQKCSVACQNNLGDPPLHVACSKGHLAMVKALTSGQHSKACNCLNIDGDTPLHAACRKGHMDIVRYLISEQRCSTACQNKDGNTPLHVACREGHQGIAEMLLTVLNCSAAYMSKNTYGRTVLHYSCQHGWLDMTRRLVEQYHCDPENRDSGGDTPLHVACLRGHLNIVRYLISEQGYSSACWNENGDTPLHVACRIGHVDIVRYLVTKRECSIACWNKLGDTPLHEACRAGHLVMVESLVCGKNCSTACISKNKNGKTVLHYVCLHGWLDVTKRLVEQYHCDPESRDNDSDTPLHVACRKGHVDIVRYLVSKEGCSIACQNKDGDTPLHVACKSNRTSIVQFLLSTGRADPWCKNAHDQTPVQLTHDYATSKLFARLTKADTVTTTKVFIFGNPAAGKSTLVKVIESKVTSRFGALAGRFRNMSEVELKTAGINTVTIQNSRLGSVTIYDLAGQFEYYSSHDAMIGYLMSSSTAIFIAVVKLNESEAEVIRALRYWISFIENCCSRVEATAHFMVVGSWADQIKQAGGNADQKWSNVKKACIFSSSTLHFVGFTALDCRKLASSGLDKIYDMIGSSCTALREAAEQEKIIYPHLLHAFISTKLSSGVAYSVKELCTFIRAEGDALLPTEPNLLSPLLNSLNDGGHLLYLPNKEDCEAGWIVINKQAVLSEINGTIFAPEYFKQHHDIATSTGVVPKSKIADVFAEKYNIDMILCVLTAFEFCQKIKDSSTLSLIASSDPTRDGAAAMTTSVESSESYYFFPALVQVEHPTDVWQSSGPGQYQCGWCLQCSKEGQYLTPRFLHVLVLRLAFSFALAPDSFQQDEASPVLRRKCAIWKNGIQWLDQDGVETIVEVLEQNKLALLLMSCPEGEEMACVQLRSSLISKMLEAKEEICPGISTTELLIDPSNLSSYPLLSSSKLTLYTMADQVVRAVREDKQFAVDITGRRKMKLVDALHFEPYLGMPVQLIDQLFDKDLARHEVDTNFLHDLAESIHPKLTKEDPKAMKKMLQMFNISDSRLFYSYFEQFPNEKDNPIMKCFRLFLTWKNCDTGGSTYQSLRTTLDKYSIFCGRNPVSNNVQAARGY